MPTFYLTFITALSSAALLYSLSCAALFYSPST